MRSKILFVVGLVFCLTPWAPPPLALVVGLVFGAIATHPYPGESRQISKYLLQAAVVGLGFGMNLHQVLHAGRSGFVYTAVGIAFAMLVGNRCLASYSRSIAGFVPDLDRHRHLRRQRYRCGRPGAGRHRRRDVGIARHGLPAELGRPADVSRDRNCAEALANSNLDCGLRSRFTTPALSLARVPSTVPWRWRRAQP